MPATTGTLAVAVGAISRALSGNADDAARIAALAADPDGLAAELNAEDERRESVERTLSLVDQLLG